MATKLSPEAISVLGNIVCNGNIAKITVPDLERGLYEEVNETLNRLMGQWDRSKGGHVFTYEPEAAIRSVVHLGFMPDKNPTAFFPTPDKLVDNMFNSIDDIHYFDYRSSAYGIRVLEPSAGQGAIAKRIRSRFPHAAVDTVEFLDINQEVLKEEGFEPFCGSFLDFNTNYEIKYDLIMMNPPFSVEGDKMAFATHIEHAYKMLAENGELVAIAPTGWLTASDKRSKAFREWVELGAEYDIVDKGAFKESGTMVETCIIRKAHSPWKLKPKDEFNNHYEADFDLTVRCSFDLERYIDKSGHSDESLDACIDKIQSEYGRMFGNAYPEVFRDGYRKILRKICDEIFEERRYANGDDPEEDEEELDTESDTVEEAVAIIEQENNQTPAKEDAALGGLFAA